MKFQLPKDMQLQHETMFKLVTNIQPILFIYNLSYFSFKIACFCFLEKVVSAFF